MRYLSTPPATASAVMRPKFLAQSHTISRHLSSNAPASPRSLYISKNRTKRQLLQAACGKNPTAIRPVPMHADRDLRRRRRRLSSPSHNCVNHSSNKCQPALVRTLLPEHNPTIPRTRRDTLPPSAKFFSESKKTYQFTHQFAPLRANLILTSRTDRIQSRASHEPVPRFDPRCASAPPAATTPAPFTQPPVEPGRQAAAARIPRLALPWYTSASPRESAVPVANRTKGSWPGLTTTPPNRRRRTPQGVRKRVLRLKRPHAHRAQIDDGRSPAICCHRSIRLAEPSRISVENLVSE